MSRLRLGVIGAGYWGEILIRIFNARDDAHIDVVCDVNAERRGMITNAKTVATAAEVLGRDDVDAVLVATPPSTHAALAGAVLRADKHCWVEKPLAMRAAEARELVNLARDRGRVLFVDETFLYDPLLEQAKAWIDAGRLGRLYHLSFERLAMGRIRRDSDVWWNAAPHDVAILCYLAPGNIERVQVERFAYVQPGIADVAVSTITLSGGVSAHISVSWLSPLKAARLLIVGSNGLLHYEGRFGQRALELFEYEVADPKTVADNVVPIPTFAATARIRGGAEEPLALAAAAFLTSIRTGVPAPSAGEYSQRVVEILEAGAAAGRAARARCSDESA